MEICLFLYSFSIMFKCILWPGIMTGTEYSPSREQHIFCFQWWVKELGLKHPVCTEYSGSTEKKQREIGLWICLVLLSILLISILLIIVNVLCFHGQQESYLGSTRFHLLREVFLDHHQAIINVIHVFVNHVLCARPYSYNTFIIFTSTVWRSDYYAHFTNEENEA